MNKKPILITFLAVGGLTYLASIAVAADKVTSLRAGVPISEKVKTPPLMSWQKDRDPIPRDYVQQPPLIPHKIDRYEITAKHNKCMTCHSWTTYKKSGATKISLTHFKDRAGTDMANVSPRRYFCNQCHVPQVDAPALVRNNFKPVEAVRGSK